MIKVNKFIFFREQKSTHISPPDDRCLCYEQLFGLSSGREKPSDTTSLVGMGGKISVTGQATEPGYRKIGLLSSVNPNNYSGWHPRATPGQRIPMPNPDYFCVTLGISSSRWAFTPRTKVISQTFPPSRYFRLSQPEHLCLA